ncbi:MAG: glycosyltransferase family 2 protein [Lachnospiraceae bacterium]|nr:glycosyltransferase family 2 protein [Lachnospiraceae bacterium]
MDISIVIPVYGCRDALYELYTRLTNTLRKITDKYEIVFVNDACPQGSWEVIKDICENDCKVVGLNLSKNFGQHRAILAGLDICRGDAVVVMDCDLQDRPEHIAQMYEKLREGYDIVWARRVNRKDKNSVKIFSKLFYRICNLFTDKDIDANLSNYCIAKKKVIKEQCRMREHCRDFSVFQQWLGFSVAYIDLESDERASGESSYSFAKKLKLAFDIVTSQSNKPLHLSIGIGFAFVIISVIIIIYGLINYFVFGDVIEGWTSLLISIYMVGGIILMFLGVIGLYIGKIFDETKNRPLYVVKDRLNYEEDRDHRGIIPSGASYTEGKEQRD